MLNKRQVYVRYISNGNRQRPVPEKILRVGDRFRVHIPLYGCAVKGHKGSGCVYVCDLDSCRAHQFVDEMRELKGIVDFSYIDVQVERGDKIEARF